MELEKLTASDIKYGHLPLVELLKDSVYYPACWSDGRPIALSNTQFRRQVGVNSFVYADFNMSESQLLGELETLRGYHIVGHRSVRPEEWQVPGFKLDLAYWEKESKNYKSTFLGQNVPFEPFCHWTVYERNDNRSPLYGPKRLSLLYFGAEGLAVFQQLYVAHHIAPRMLCFVACFGFSGNWSCFTNPEASFCYTLKKHPECMPEWVMLGDMRYIHSAQRLAGLEFLGIKLVDYGLKDQDCITVRANEFRQTNVFQRDGRNYLALRVSYSMAPVIYDITDSPYDLECIVNNLILSDKILKNEDILNNWVGFEPHEFALYDGRTKPEVSLDVINRPDWKTLPYDERANVVACRVVDQVYKIVIHEDVKLYTRRMRNYLHLAYQILEKASEKDPDLQPKFEESRMLIRHLDAFCTRVA